MIYKGVEVNKDDIILYADFSDSYKPDLNSNLWLAEVISTDEYIHVIDILQVNVSQRTDYEEHYHLDKEHNTIIKNFGNIDKENIKNLYPEYFI